MLLCGAQHDTAPVLVGALKATTLETVGVIDFLLSSSPFIPAWH